METQERNYTGWETDFSARAEFEDVNGHTNRETFNASLWIDQIYHECGGYLPYVTELMQEGEEYVLSDRFDDLVKAFEEFGKYGNFTYEQWSLIRNLVADLTEIIKEEIESWRDNTEIKTFEMASRDVGSVWRVNFMELAEGFAHTFIEDSVKAAICGCRQIPTVVGCSDCDPSVKAGA